MKNWASWVVGLGMLSAVHAYDNEPVGFRGLDWGTPASALRGFNENSDARSILDNVGKRYGDIAMDGFPLRSYEQRDDKLVFGNTILKGVSYVFYKDQFIMAVLSYVDGSKNWDGKTYTVTPGMRLPETYSNAYEASTALRRYFGSPSRSLWDSLKGDKRPLYQGDVTNIDNLCRDDSAICQITFSSKQLSTQYAQDLNDYIAGKQAEIAGRRARPDY